MRSGSFFLACDSCVLMRMSVRNAIWASGSLGYLCSSRCRVFSSAEIVPDMTDFPTVVPSSSSFVPHLRYLSWDMIGKEAQGR